MGNKKFDKVGATILAAFFVMSGTHMYCRYDVGAMVDSLFKKVSAETVATAPLTQAPIAAAPAGVPVLEDAQSETIQQPTIARNPFLVPAGALPVATAAVPGRAPGVPAGAGSVASPVPVQESRPVVKGIVSSGNDKVAIIEYKGRSNTYRVGQSISDAYSVDEISGSGVSINGHSVPLGGRG